MSARTPLESVSNSSISPLSLSEPRTIPKAKTLKPVPELLLSPGTGTLVGEQELSIHGPSKAHSGNAAETINQELQQPSHSLSALPRTALPLSSEDHHAVAMDRGLESTEVGDMRAAVAHDKEEKLSSSKQTLPDPQSTSVLPTTPAGLSLPTLHVPSPALTALGPTSFLPHTRTSSTIPSS